MSSEAARRDRTAVVAGEAGVVCHILLAVAWAVEAHHSFLGEAHHNGPVEVVVRCYIVAEEEALHTRSSAAVEDSELHIAEADIVAAAGSHCCRSRTVEEADLVGYGSLGRGRRT